MLKLIHANIRAPFQYPIRRLIIRSHEVLKLRDRQFKLSYRCEIWKTRRQQCCRGTCQISERLDYSKYKSRGIETSRDLTKRHLIGYWNGAQVSVSAHQCFHTFSEISSYPWSMICDPGSEVLKGPSEEWTFYIILTCTWEYLNRRYPGSLLASDPRLLHSPSQVTLVGLALWRTASGHAVLDSSIEILCGEISEGPVTY